MMPWTMLNDLNDEKSNLLSNVTAQNFNEHYRGIMIWMHQLLVETRRFYYQLAMYEIINSDSYIFNLDNYSQR